MRADRSILRTLLPIGALAGIPGLLGATAEAPLGSPRLAAAPAFSLQVDDLAAGSPAGVFRRSREGVTVLDLPAGAGWTLPLRGGGARMVFVSVVAQVSASTVLEAAGVRLGFTASPVAGALQVMRDDPAGGWKPLGLHVAGGRHEDRELASAPVLTIRVDPGRGLWDLFAGARLVAHDLPLPAGPPRVRLLAGAAGAWLQGVVQSDDHPWWEDTDRDGIDDAFTRRLALPLADRPARAAAWREAQRRDPPPAPRLRRPRGGGEIRPASGGGEGG